MILARKQTITAHGWQAIFAHPLIATLVPTWFAATFALSTLAVRGALIEHLVLSSQIDLILPMATPPLGMTARLLLAALFGAFGGFLGWLAVRLIAPSKAERPARRPAANPHPAYSDTPARRPIWAHEELGADGFDSPLTARALPVRRDQVDAAPATVGPVVVPVVSTPVPTPAPLAVAPEGRAPKPLPLSAGFPTPPVNGPSAADHIARAPLESLSHIELIERLAIAMQRHHAATAHLVAGHSRPATDNAGSPNIPDTGPATAPNSTSEALRAALAGLREVK